MTKRYTLGEQPGSGGTFHLLDDGKPVGDGESAWSTPNVIANISDECEITCGCFYGGVFHGGVFEGGRYYGGEFFDGYFISGNFFGGRYHSGVIKGGVFLDGVFNGGENEWDYIDSRVVYFTSLHNIDGTPAPIITCTSEYQWIEVYPV